MRFIILVKATRDTEAGVMPSEDALEQQVAFAEELTQHGYLYDATGLKATSEGWRIRFDGGGHELIEGPFEFSEQLVAGYTIIDVPSREDAIAWSMRFPNPGPDGPVEIEVRPFFELEDFVQGPAIGRFRELAPLDRLARSVADARPDLAPATAPNGTVTIMFTDIESSTELTEHLGDREWFRVLQEHNALIRARVERHGGFEVKAQGDGFMLAFPSASDALRCAIDIQRELAAGAASGGGSLLRVRMGLHTGEPVREADDFYGKAVILAARIAAEARGTEIAVSSLVRELTESAGEFSFDDPVDRELKGLRGTFRVSSVRWEVGDG